MKIDAVAQAIKRDLESIVLQALRVEPPREPRRTHQPDRAFFEHASADTGEHVLLAGSLQNQGVDADTMQELTQQQARRPRADDDDLLAHSGRPPGPGASCPLTSTG